MASAVRSALVRSALERLSGPWLREAAAFGLLQGRSWVVSWPPGPAPAPPDLTVPIADSLAGTVPDEQRNPLGRQREQPPRDDRRAYDRPREVAPGKPARW